MSPTSGLSAALAQYTPLRFASPANFQHQWPPAHSHAVPYPSVAEDFENMPPTPMASQDGGERGTKKRKHHEERDTTNDKRFRMDRAQAYGNPCPQQHATDYEPAYNSVQAAPMRYVTGSGSFETVDRQRATPTAPSSHIPFGTPSLPGAARYIEQRFGHSAPPSHSDIYPPGTLCAHEPMAHERPPTPPGMRDHKRRKTHVPQEHHTPGQLYPVLPDPSGLPRGTQHDPLEIPSSPEQAPKSKSSRKKKKNFYAVAVGHVPGIYKDWNEAERQTKGYSDAKHKGFATESEARAWYEEHKRAPKPSIGSGNSFSGTAAVSIGAPQQATASIPPMAPGQMLERSASSDSGMGGPLAPNDVHGQMPSDAPDYIPLPPGSPATAPPQHHIPSVEPEPVLKPEQQKVVDLILEGQNVFYTGSAGCVCTLTKRLRRIVG